MVVRKTVGITRGPPAAGIPLDGEALSLDIAQPAQLREKCLKNGTPVDKSNRTWNNDRNPMLLRRLLRRCRWHGGREQQTHREIAPPHSITSSAAASSAGGSVRPSATGEVSTVYLMDVDIEKLVKFLSEKRDVPAEMRLLPARHTVGEKVIGFSETGDWGKPNPEKIPAKRAAGLRRPATARTMPGGNRDYGASANSW
jgi:hypothetical protein